MAHRLRLATCLVAAAAAAAHAQEVVLTTGDVLHGKVAAHTTEQLVLEHPVLGTLEIPAASVLRVTPGVPITQPPAAPPPKLWARELAAGISGARGNSDTTDARIGIVATRKTDRTALKLDAAYYYGSANAASNKNKLTAGLLHDWLRPGSPWLYFAKARWDLDQFQSWDCRISGHGGAGYRLVEREGLSAKLRLGAGASKEWGSDDDGLRPEALLGGEVAWRISERQKLGAGTTLYPDLSDAGELRALSTVNWDIALERADGLQLRLGLEHEYQSIVDAGNDHSDLRLLTSLVFRF